jgi:hypothetical protein
VLSADDVVLAEDTAPEAAAVPSAEASDASVEALVGAVVEPLSCTDTLLPHEASPQSIAAAMIAIVVFFIVLFLSDVEICILSTFL